MSDIDAVGEHYTSGRIWERLRDALIDDGVNPDVPTVETLAPYDQFHGRGLEVTAELADRMKVSPTDHILDVGGGLGGPARYLVDRFGCLVSSIDLTAEFCEVAERLNTLMGFDDRVSIFEGSALDMPFDDGSFDGAYSMNVSMNIEDRAGLYREIWRVLRPDGWLVLSEIARGPNDGLVYPTAWADSEASSFLLSPDETRGLLEANGFRVTELADRSVADAKAGAKARELVEQGQKPPQRAVGLVHGTDSLAVANGGRGFREAQILPIEVHCIRQH